MNRIRAAVTALLLAVFFAVPAAGQAQEKGRKLTIMVYLCGSNLESSYGSATSDLHEMLQARYDPKQVTLLVMAGGTSAWTAGYDVQETRILEIDNGKTRTVWNGGLLNMGSEEALGYLLHFGQEKYPAEGYALILWDHGGGPLEGVCWDELFSMDSLSLSELTRALDSANLPGRLRWIGFDACLMGSAEVAAALAPYAEYMIASQETEPASGWNYAFLNGTEEDESGADTGRRIVDAYYAGEPDSAAPRTMACINLDKIDAVRTAMDDFFEPLSREVNTDSFSRLSGLRFSAASFGKAGGDDAGNGYDLVDLRDLIRQYSRENSGDTLLGAIGDAVVYSRSDTAGSSGLSVYHPYDNKQKYMDRWRGDYEALAFCSGYEAYIGRFGAILTGQTLADWIGLATETVPVEDGEETCLRFS